VGLTIHYELTVPNKWSIQTVRDKLEALRQTCMDLPVVDVSNLQEFTGDECRAGEDKADPFRWAKIQAGRRLDSPWQPGISHYQPPHHPQAQIARTTRSTAAPAGRGIVPRPLQSWLLDLPRQLGRASWYT